MKDKLIVSSIFLSASHFSLRLIRDEYFKTHLRSNVWNHGSRQAENCKFLPLFKIRRVFAYKWPLFLYFAKLRLLLKINTLFSRKCVRAWIYAFVGRAANIRYPIAYISNEPHNWRIYASAVLKEVMAVWPIYCNQSYYIDLDNSGSLIESQWGSRINPE